MKKGWRVTELGEIVQKGESDNPTARPQSRFVYVDVSSVSNSTFEIVETTEILGAEAPSRARRKIRTDDVIFATIRPTLKRIAMVPSSLNEQICSTGYIVLRAKPNVLPRYIYYYLFTDPFQMAMEQLQTGASYPAVTEGQVKQQPIALPPLEEQQRIVAILDEAFEGLDRARANAEANLRNARELFSVAIEASLERAGGADYTLARLLEKNWIVSHLDGNHGSNYPRKEEFVDEGVPYISANCIDGDVIDLSRCKFLPSARADTLRKGTAKDRDVIFAHNATVGPVALLQTDEPRVLLSTSLTHYRCNEDYIIPEFLLFAMRGAGFKRQYEAVMGQATRNQVPITNQRTFTHRIPRMDEQLKIAELGKEIERATRELEKNYEQQRNDVYEVRQSLLSKAFAGELT